jgi:DNA invertase Pin-like site-specific DNA recombinase
MTVIAEYIDRALTGTKDQRPDFQRMIEDAANKRFEYVIVWKLDRFARNRYDSAIYKSKLKKYGVKVVSAMENITDSPEGIILEGLLESMAEYYSANLSENTIRGKRETASKGYWNGGKPPLGYKIVDRRLVEDEKTAPTVRYVFERYAAGDSKAKIIQHLASKGIKNAYGGELTYSCMNTVLRNETYIGKPTYNGQIVDGLAEQLISEELFWKVQEQLKRRALAPGAKKAKADYLLSGKVFCGDCGGNMIGMCGRSKNGSQYFYYRCSNRRFPFRCKKKNERKELLEQFVVEQTLRFILTPEQIRKISKAVVAEYEKEFSRSEVDKLRRALDQVERELNKLVDALIDSPKIARQKIYEKMESLGAQKEDLEGNIAKMEAASNIRLTEEEVAAWMMQFKDGDPSDIEFQRRIIDLFVNSVFLYDDKVVIFYNIRGGKRQAISFSEMNTAPGKVPGAVSECSHLNTSACTNKTKNEHYFVFVSGMLGLIIPVIGGSIGK